MATPATNAPFPLRFVVVTFAISIVIGVVIAYYGMQGHLGWGVP